MRVNYRRSLKLEVANRIRCEVENITVRSSLPHGMSSDFRFGTCRLGSVELKTVAYVSAHGTTVTCVYYNFKMHTLTAKL